MAEKEATVYVLDVGASMGKKRNGRQETDLEWAMQYVWDKITSTVATGRNTLAVGVIGLRTDGTKNGLSMDESFEHISVLHPLGQVLMPDLVKLREDIQVSGTKEGDAISALVIAIDMIGSYCKKNKWRRRIVLITDGRGLMDDDGIGDIVTKIKDEGIEVIVLGIDFDDPEFGVKEEDKDPEKANHEQLLKNFIENCEGIFGTMAQAVSELGIPRVKIVNSQPNFKGWMTLGDPESSTSMRIEVHRYPRIFIAKAPSASSFVALQDAKKGEASTESSATIIADGTADPETGLTVVRSNRTYQVEDARAAGGKREVDRNELAKGYEYGRTAVHISESDENVTTLETKASLEIMGFLPRNKYERYMSLSTSCIIIAQKANEKAGMALSSFIHALFELDSCAIARLVPKDDKPPVIVLLAPSIEVDFECLVDVQLPFAEDVRPYRFPPLDRILTVSGKTVTEHRNLPNAQLRQAMSDYVDQMDLSEFGIDDEGKRTEYMAMEDTYSPLLHRIDQAVRWRAIHPSEHIPPVPEVLTRYSKPPLELEQKARPQLEKLIAAADVKKVPPKRKGRREKRVAAKPLSGLNVEELLGREKRSTISPDNAVPEFKQLLATAQNTEAIQDTSKQMSSVIVSLIKHSLGDSGYGRAIENLRVMREELIGMEEPRLYNDFVKDLKKKLLAEQLNGDRREMWWEVRRNQLGLVTDKESEVSDVAEDEAKSFLSSK
ncbi:MAG: ATP-dependent DNA helicase II subunit 2 [Peltula sp. TS41687]|nr:MAG: ATP-dependent DNA helicase II subunit 2 [Peltula sp. TS41687]